jgi:predicted MPP superfamily phosphohydrolase
MITYAAVLLVIILIYFGYRYFRCVNRLELQPGWLYKAIYVLFPALFLSYPAAGHLQYRIQGSFYRTGFPDPVIYLFWYGVVCMGVMLNWLLLHDLLRPVALWFAKKDADIIKRYFASCFLALAAFTVIYTAGKMAWDTHRITIEEIAWTMPEGTTPGETLTIVHIADLHADPYTREPKLSRYIEKVNLANPDIVIVAGDLITSGEDHIEAGAGALAAIEATHGVYFVMGDHDYWVSTEQIARALTERGITVLLNENILVRHGESRIKITGVTELYSSRVAPEVLEALLNEEMEETLHILTAHQATGRLIREAGNSGVHQLLAGHTHGGQIRVPLFFYPLTAASAETRYVNGNWMIGDMLLNINNGLGFTLAPVRYKAPAQVSIITVKNEER